MATFGKTDIGSKESGFSSNYTGYCIYTLSEDGDITKITFYTGGTSNQKCKIYAVSDTTVGALLAESSPVSVGPSFSWVDFVLNVSLSAADYALGWISDAYMYLKYERIPPE